MRKGSVMIKNGPRIQSQGNHPNLFIRIFALSIKDRHKMVARSGIVMTPPQCGGLNGCEPPKGWPRSQVRLF